MLINCSDCGKIVSDKAEICPKCSCPIEISIIENKIYNKTISLSPYSDKTFPRFQILAILLGPFGIHNFYIGRNIIATIQLTFGLIFLVLSIFISEFRFFWIIVYLLTLAESATVSKDSKGLILQNGGFK